MATLQNGVTFWENMYWVRVIERDVERWCIVSATLFSIVH